MDDTEKREKHIEYRNKKRQQNEMETRKELKIIDIKMVAIDNKQKRYNIHFLKVSEEEGGEREGGGREREREGKTEKEQKSGRNKYFKVQFT